MGMAPCVAFLDNLAFDSGLEAAGLSTVMCRFLIAGDYGAG